MRSTLRTALSALSVLVLSAPSNAVEQQSSAHIAGYNSATGELTVTIEGDSVVLLGFHSRDLFDPSLPTKLGTIPVLQYYTGVMAWFDAAGLPSGTFNLGPVLPKGLVDFPGPNREPALLQFDYGIVGGEVFSVYDILYQIVPEPSCPTLASCAALAAAFARRRLKRQEAGSQA